MRTTMAKIFAWLFITTVGFSGAWAQETAGVEAGQPIRLIVPFPRDGATDVMARAVAASLLREQGEKVVVENHPGQTGLLAAEVVTRAKPDGKTLLFATSSTLSIIPNSQANRHRDLNRQLRPVVQVASSPNMVLVGPRLGIANIADLVRAGKTPGRKLSFASAGHGSITHLTGELFLRGARIDMSHVPYMGTAFAFDDVANGKVDVLFDNVVAAMPHIRSGRLVPLAVGSATRLPVLKDTPTVDESAVRGFRSVSWYGIVAPRATPDHIVHNINKAMNRALENAETRKVFADMGSTIVGGTPADLEKIIEHDSQMWARLLKDVEAGPVSQAD